jgi:succinyl-CoA synthetase alpha subunit
MRIATEVESIPGVVVAALMMGTPSNLAVMERAGLLFDDATRARSNDLVVAVRARDDAAAEAAIARARELLLHGLAAGPARSGAPEWRPASFGEAVAAMPDANLAIVSVPGDHATAATLDALQLGLDVFLFSDNVPLADEVYLKRMAFERGLLLMGPDCGTSLLDGIPLGFVNVVHGGSIGLIGASGTGLQEVSCQIHHAGLGISRMIGVGGRDLSNEVGGLMTLTAIERLAGDGETRVIVIISKPASDEVIRRVLEAARATRLPCVACFVGRTEGSEADGVELAATLSAAAELAVELARGTSGAGACKPETPRRIATPGPSARGVLGLYTGGTLGYEAAGIIGAHGRIVDLGDDEHTVGRPHPMIDPRNRNEHILAAGDDEKVGVLLLDFVLGHGSHPDPAGAALAAIAGARARAARAGRSLHVVASVTGTELDPQHAPTQIQKLREAGVIVEPNNAAAAMHARGLVTGGDA